MALTLALVEAALVTYLRRWLDPGGVRFPAVAFPPDLLRWEQAREIATLVLLVTVATRSARGGIPRLAAFLVLFGFWDLAYYGFLRALLGWPTSLTDVDLLFLVPWPWWSPVYAPVVVAATMATCGGLALIRVARRGSFPLHPRHLVAAGVAALIILSTMVRPGADLHDPPEASTFARTRFLGGWLLGVAAYVDAWRRGRT